MQFKVIILTDVDTFFLSVSLFFSQGFKTFSRVVVSTSVNTQTIPRLQITMSLFLSLRLQLRTKNRDARP